MTKIKLLPVEKYNTNLSIIFSAINHKISFKNIIENKYYFYIIQKSAKPLD
jgi:hypothetical protein